MILLLFNVINAINAIIIIRSYDKIKNAREEQNVKEFTPSNILSIRSQCFHTVFSNESEKKDKKKKLNYYKHEKKAKKLNIPKLIFSKLRKSHPKRKKKKLNYYKHEKKQSN
jgi:hypothetical protein